MAETALEPSLSWISAQFLTLLDGDTRREEIIQTLEEVLAQGFGIGTALSWGSLLPESLIFSGHIPGIRKNGSISSSWILRLLQNPFYASWLPEALRGYKDINLQALKLIAQGGVSSSPVHAAMP